MTRCDWAMSNAAMQVYHDTVWGRPEYDDQQLFRKLVLDMNQAGLSWQTILNKMANFDQAYDDFDIQTVAGYTEAKVESLMMDAGIIRNRRKIEAAIHNAQQVLVIQKEYGSFAAFLWQYVNDQPIVNHFEAITEVPTHSVVSDQLAKDLKKRGFKFVGTTTIYAFMEAVGMVNDHLVTCICRQDQGHEV
ncbi:DNA-3-methyladenine glycosylase I [Enterococcus sp. RIT-PI-f]|uniref:DNA-3-methyladenine glycosylase I n=1 Tax=Enterococcus sp. RIT-PI-f TaxID=1690244 RepID=UPI0006B939DB|nr:DNA-3-methyladenine glycosylase I [Enterococcus sp. RIT-PI-f]KPG71104.1 3-methyladenine DNA glycosylase [Enterococcus sp. RIT-PI-f]